ncbi:DUF1800 domain-containing protein [Thermomonas sp.]|uniref:DUF1800 domain-containing protein n=1 Tax=Thermomonas sp. TaxID=1971895 RepID=UPI002488A3E7|nr:DUF1800 domain-containing protein [Thermomonas sp.]MDI1252088.1 DUF1800 domain-containing protein [Thermomonas sp.]
MTTVTAAAAANRFGLGADADELTRIGGDPRGWLRTQLKPGAIDAFAGLPGSADYLSDYYAIRQMRRETKGKAGNAQAAAAADDSTPKRVAMPEQRAFRRKLMQESILRQQVALRSQQPFAERIVRFWSNHFAISVDKRIAAPFAAPMEREAIRPHAFGNFADLLLAVERHPGMLLYLDNAQSVGGDSRLAERSGRRQQANPQQRKRGLNENLARETLELHTLGVDGGYSQADVIELARAITGWSVASPRDSSGMRGDDAFVFRANAHEPGARHVLGKTCADDGEAQGRHILHNLALHPATARHLSFKLARHFVADVPPPALVDRMARAYLASGGELTAMYRPLIDDDAAWSTDARKFKTPDDFTLSALRACGLYRPGDVVVSLDLLARMGQPLFQPRSPAGFADTAADWSGPDALFKRVQAAQALAERVPVTAAVPLQMGMAALGPALDPETATALRRAESVQQGIALLLASPAFQWRC